MTATDIEERTDTDELLETDTPRVAHIVDRGSDERPAWALVLEALVNGSWLVALCGHRWIPSRDPKDLPICPKCTEIFEFAADFRSGETG